MVVRIKYNSIPCSCLNGSSVQTKEIVFSKDKKIEVIDRFQYFDLTPTEIKQLEYIAQYDTRIVYVK